MAHIFIPRLLSYRVCVCLQNALLSRRSDSANADDVQPARLNRVNPKIDIDNPPMALSNFVRHFATQHHMVLLPNSRLFAERA